MDEEKLVPGACGRGLVGRGTWSWFLLINGTFRALEQKTNEDLVEITSERSTRRRCEF